MITIKYFLRINVLSKYLKSFVNIPTHTLYKTEVNFLKHPKESMNEKYIIIMICLELPNEMERK